MSHTPEKSGYSPSFDRAIDDLREIRAGFEEKLLSKDSWRSTSIDKVIEGIKEIKEINSELLEACKEIRNIVGQPIMGYSPEVANQEYALIVVKISKLVQQAIAKAEGRE